MSDSLAEVVVDSTIEELRLSSAILHSGQLQTAYRDCSAAVEIFDSETPYAHVLDAQRIFRELNEAFYLIPDAINSEESTRRSDEKVTPRNVAILNDLSDMILLILNSFENWANMYGIDLRYANTYEV